MNTRRCLCAFGQFKQTQSAVVGTQPPMGTALRRMTPLLTELTFSIKKVQSFLLGSILKVLWCAFHSGAILI